MRLFLSHSFSSDNLEPGARSDQQVADWFKEMIEAYSDGKIQVVTARQAQPRAIHEKVIEAIDSCDAVFCLFTRRHRDPINGEWLPSQYVLSESAFTAGRYLDRPPRKRIFGWIERGVNRRQLGIAFPDDLELPEFSRHDLAQCEPRLREYVRGLLTEPPPAEPPVPARRLHKTVTVRRNGAVLIHSRYTFQVLDPTDLRIPHALWRVRERLPPFNDMRECDDDLDGRTPFFRYYFVGCTNHEASPVEMKIDNIRQAYSGSEWTFDISFNGLRPRKGALLEYDLSWGYPGAFLGIRDVNDTDAPPWNSVGLRPWHRGVIGEAVLQLCFERNWSPGVQLPIFKEPPQLSFHDSPVGAHDGDPRKLWDKRSGWFGHRPMDRHAPHADIRYETYQWSERDCHRLVRATWVPSVHYHHAAVPPPKMPAYFI